MNELKPIETLILNLRGRRVILDADLAGIYGVATKVLNQAVKRKPDRFPEDFMFKLTSREWSNLKSQSVTSSLEIIGNKASNRSQFAPTSHGGRRSLPYAFTEHGAIMVASILNSPEAVAMSVFVVRAFVQIRERLAEAALLCRYTYTPQLERMRKSGTAVPHSERLHKKTAHWRERFIENLPAG